MLVTTASPCWRRDPAQRQMAGVKVAHRRHESDSLGARQALGELGGGVDDIHAIPVRGGWAERSAAASGARGRIRSNARAAGNDPSFTAATYALSAASMLSWPVMKLRTKRCRTARRDAKCVVDYQHLTRAWRSGADAEAGS